MYNVYIVIKCNMVNYLLFLIYLKVNSILQCYVFYPVVELLGVQKKFRS